MGRERQGVSILPAREEQDWASFSSSLPLFLSLSLSRASVLLVVSMGGAASRLSQGKVCGTRGNGTLLHARLLANRACIDESWSPLARGGGSGRSLTGWAASSGGQWTPVIF